jgi:hypothetical protein
VSDADPAKKPAPAKKVVDPAHPEAKALTDAGIPIERLNTLVNSATTPIVHDAVTTGQNTVNQLAAQATAQQQAEAAIPNIAPPLDTEGLYSAEAMGPQFEQMLAELTTPQVPANPQLVSMTPPTGPTSGG